MIELFFFPGAVTPASTLSQQALGLFSTAVLLAKIRAATTANIELELAPGPDGHEDCSQITLA